MNKNRSLRKCILSLFCILSMPLLLITTRAIPVAGQSASGITLSAPDTSQFPVISTTFGAIDLAGHFVKDLKAEEIQIMENERMVAADSLELVQKGVRFYLAVNESRTFSNRFEEISRFDRLKNHLQGWIKSHPDDTKDEFYFFSNMITPEIAPNVPDEWETAVNNYQPDLKKAVPSLASLNSAVDALLDDGTEATTSAALLYITPLPTAQEILEIKDLLTIASRAGSQVNLWLIGPPEYSTNELAYLLQQYTRESGGAYLLYSGAETLPPIADLLDPLGSLYSLKYTSAAKASGDYKLKVNVRRTELYLESNEQAFSLSILPPNPIFLSPPAEIARSWSETKKRSDSVLLPDQVEVRILIEFPDGFQRPLVSSRLLIDGKLADENTAEPFDLFSLDLADFTASGEHTLKAEVEDSIDLKGETIEIPVAIVIEQKEEGWIGSFLPRITLVNGVIGGIVLLTLILGIIALVRYGMLNRRDKKTAQAPDPLTQPVNISGEYSLSPAKSEEAVAWPLIRGVGLAPARLACRNASEADSEKCKEIPLSGEEITIGSDHRKADVVITHSSVSPAHARIFKDANSDFHLADAGSSAGTWLNYAPVSSRGARLEHGDLVQFGRVSYVFELRGATRKRIQVLPFQEE